MSRSLTQIFASAVKTPQQTLYAGLSLASLSPKPEPDVKHYMLIHAIPARDVRGLLHSRFALPSETATDIADRCGGDGRQALADAKAFRIALKVAA